ncbi:uncharacterized protein LOC119464548 [Dermacentor silvarum]|uniref:uncharacterized protein LOC119464548 n=1 Tax=Dermacentor silvarum TaxID=543639 RepID=UPI002100D406|nr:uncharacterized protein LOC119464548 [Dermacentor silvarum]
MERRQQLLLLKKKLLLLIILKRQDRRRRRWWVRPVFMHRKEEGLYYTAMRRMREGDHDFFFKFYRMTPQMFDALLSFVVDDLKREYVVREPLEPGERLAITLSYLASGQEVKDVAMAYRVGIETARLCIHFCCRVIWARLKDRFMKVPSEADWTEIAQGFASQWQFPNCLGAVDGKHVAITAPANSGSLYFNYKSTFSIVLMAAVDSNYQYTIIDVGAQGRQSDGGILKNSEFGKALASGTLGTPSASCLPGTRTAAPYAFVGDEAFQLRKDFMRPFPAKQLTDERRVFNYRLSRARRCVENAFGITAARWRVLLRTINLHPTNVDYVIKAACILHNFIMKLNAQTHGYVDREDSFGNVIPGHWRQSVEGEARDGSQSNYFSLASTHARNFPTEAADARNIFTAYFCSTFGEVAWQWQQPGVSKDVALKHLQDEQLLPLIRK